MSWRHFWIVLAAVVTSAVGFLPATAGWDAVLVGVVAAVLCAVVWGAAHKAVVTAPALVRDYSYAERCVFGQWIGIATCMHWVWVVAVQLRPDVWWAWIGVLVVLAVAEETGARGFVYYMMRVKPAQVVVASERAEQAERSSTDQTMQVIRAGVVGAGLSWMRISSEWHSLPGGKGVTFALRVPPQAEVMSKSQRTAAKTGLSAGETAENLAISFSEVLGMRLGRHWVQVRKEDAAGEYTVTILLSDVIGEVIPYDDPTDHAGRPIQTTIQEPALIGYRPNGQERRNPLRLHSQDIGKTRSGKSSLMHVKLAHKTRCSDVIQWVCGTEKVYDLVGPWLEPYEGTDEAPPIHAVAVGPEDTAEMLAAGLRIARWRQSQRMDKRGNWPVIVITLTEASFALKHENARAYFDGQNKHASALAADILKGAGASDVWLELDAQRSTQDQLGDSGGDISTNLGASTIFRSNDRQEVGRVTGDYQLPTPQHRGEFWLDADEELPEKLKAPYIQEDDPSKDKLHDGQTLKHIAWSRRLLPTVELDAGSANVAGRTWTRRHTRVDAACMDYLTGNAPAAPSDERSPGVVERAEADAVLDRLLPELVAPEPRQEITPGVDTADEVGSFVSGDTSGPEPATGEDETAPEPVGSPFEVAPAVGGHRKDRIARIVAGADGSMQRGEIIAALHAAGDQVKDQVVTNDLKRLVETGRLVRVDGGYTVTEGQQTHKQTNPPVGAVSRARA